MFILIYEFLQYESYYYMELMIICNANMNIDITTTY